MYAFNSDFKVYLWTDNNYLFFYVIMSMGDVMIHKMRLVDFAFTAMKNKEKDIEVRLNDEKRQLINIGDIIEFEQVDTKEILKVEVINLHKFNTFKELFETFDYKRIGIKENEDYTIVNNFYTKEEQEKYEALGIEVKVI